MKSEKSISRREVVDEMLKGLGEMLNWARAGADHRRGSHAGVQPEGRNQGYRYGLAETLQEKPGGWKPPRAWGFRGLWA